MLRCYEELWGLILNHIVCHPIPTTFIILTIYLFLVPDPDSSVDLVSIMVARWWDVMRNLSLPWELMYSSVYVLVYKRGNSTLAPGWLSWSTGWWGGSCHVNLALKKRNRKSRRRSPDVKLPLCSVLYFLAVIVQIRGSTITVGC